MNVILKVKPPPDVATIAHSVIAYDRATEELDLELPIPLPGSAVEFHLSGAGPIREERAANFQQGPPDGSGAPVLNS